MASHSPVVVHSHAPVAAIEPELRSFMSSMPAAYRRSFSNDVIAIHARAAAAREARTASVAACGELRNCAALCVVADDRPGLLWLISIGLAAHELEVMKAHIYCRRRTDGRTEAVDLFWVRRRGSTASSSLSTSEIEALSATINRLLTVDPPPAPDPAPGDDAPPHPRGSRPTCRSWWIRKAERRCSSSKPPTVRVCCFRSHAPCSRKMCRSCGRKSPLRARMRSTPFTCSSSTAARSPPARRAEIEAAARTAVLKAR